MRETIDELVPEKKWLKKNGRVVSQETKALFERRAKEYQKHKPTAERRKAWNKKIQIACRNDYRSWVTTWVQKIEKADNRGDTKEIYRGVKSLSGGSAFSATKPTEKLQPPLKTDPKNVATRKQAEKARARDTKSDARAREPKSNVRASAETADSRASGRVQQNFETVKETATAKTSGENPVTENFHREAVSVNIDGPEKLARV